MEAYQQLKEFVYQGATDEALAFSERLLAEAVAPLQLIDEALIPAMAEVGRLFKEGELFVPEVLMAAQTVTAVIERLKPLLAGQNVSRGKVVIGTVKGDLHDIGKNLVALLLENNGFTVIDLGVDVSGDEFLAALRGEQADILALSALLTTSMGQMEEVLQQLREAGLREAVKVMIGGAPVSADYAAEICADGYAADAAAAVDLAQQLLAGGGEA